MLSSFANFALFVSSFQTLASFLLSFRSSASLAVSASFCIVYVYSAELSPTVARTLAVGCGSMCARVGSLLSPFIGLLVALALLPRFTAHSVLLLIQGNTWRPFPSLVFGSVALAAAALALLLPETRNRRLPETMQDGEDFGRWRHKKLKFSAEYYFVNDKKPILFCRKRKITDSPQITSTTTT